MGDSANFSAEQHEAKARGKRRNLADFVWLYNSLASTIAAGGGDLDDPEVAAGDIDRKVDAIRLVMDRLASTAERRRREGELRIARAQALEKTVKGLEQWAIRNIEAAGLKRAGSIVPLSVCNNGGAQGIEWTRIGEPIPEPFRRVKTEIVLDVEAARGALKQFGKLPDGFLVKPRGKHLRVALSEPRKSSKKGGDDGKGS
jgi:hypothetical protein